jgi:fatty-acyl-CoA synthase
LFCWSTRCEARRAFPKFWLPDAFEFIDAIPRTSADKFKKTELRERYKDYRPT